MADELLDKMTKSQYIRWAAWAEAMSSYDENPETHQYEIPPDIKAKWKGLLNTPYEDLTEDEKEQLRRLAKKRLDLFLR